jgi:hypothetical protein
VAKPPPWHSDHFEHAEDERETDGDQRVDKAEHQPVQQQLGDVCRADGHGAVTMFRLFVQRTEIVAAVESLSILLTASRPLLKACARDLPGP